MTRRLQVLGAVAAVLVAAGCSSEPKAAAKPASPPTTAAPFFAKTQTVACGADLTALQTAVEIFRATNGDGPVTEAAMVSAGALRSESTLHDVQPDGTVVASPTGGCVS